MVWRVMVGISPSEPISIYSIRLPFIHSTFKHSCYMDLVPLSLERERASCGCSVVYCCRFVGVIRMHNHIVAKAARDGYVDEVMVKHGMIVAQQSR